MQQGKVIKEFQVGSVNTIYRYPHHNDLDASIKIHLALTREKVMCRRLKLNRESGRCMLADILDGLKQDQLSYIFVEQEGESVGEGFTNRSRHHYWTVGLAERLRQEYEN